MIMIEIRKKLKYNVNVHLYMDFYVVRSKNKDKKQQNSYIWIL